MPRQLASILLEVLGGGKAKGEACTFSRSCALAEPGSLYHLHVFCQSSLHLSFFFFFKCCIYFHSVASPPVLWEQSSAPSGQRGMLTLAVLRAPVRTLGYCQLQAVLYDIHHAAPFIEFLQEGFASFCSFLQPSSRQMQDVKDLWVMLF